MYGLQTNSYSLQAVLSSSSSSGETYIPHHPITCTGPLRLNEDGSFECEHKKMPPGDQRTNQCVNHSMAILLIELASKL